MAQTHLQLLGDFCLTHDGTIVGAMDTPRLRALIAYLALHRHAPQTRHYLAFLFWPDSSEAQALTNLRKQLLNLRNALPDTDTFIAIARQTIQWRPTGEFCFDVAQFEETLTQAESMADAQAINLLRRAINLYRGDLLPECYDEWIFPVRETLRVRYRSGLERLVQLLEESRDYTTAIDYAQQLLRHDPLQEATYRQLMRLYALTNDRAMALRVYHTCATQLCEELGVDPDAETQQIFERLLNRQHALPVEPTLVANAPFVGRQQEWQQLQTAWQSSQRGQPYFVLLAGEAGIGKTRLAEELLNWAYHQGIETARSRCYAAEGRLTYAPVIDWLRCEALRGQRAKVGSTWLSELARLLPEILVEWPQLPHPEPITQSWQRRHLFEAVARALLAAQQPLLLLIDDLQWCDQETLELLHFLLRFVDNLATPGASPARFMLVGTARLPDEVPAGHPLSSLLHDLYSNERLCQLDLARLNEAETSDLARQMARSQLTAQALLQLYADTAGNPLFVVETIRAGLPPTEAQSALPLSPSHQPSEGAATALPPKVLAIIQARLGQLSPTARQLCEWAAIMGREFTLDLLVVAGNFPEAVAVAALDELWQRRIVREHGTDAYDFSHDRIRDVAAAGISRVRRRYLHRAVAETLERQSAAQLDSVAAQIAAHYETAGMTEKAIAYYQQAAKVALRIYANQEAITYLNRALDLLPTLPPSRQRAEHEYHLLLMLGPPLVATQGYGSDEVHERCFMARKLAKVLNYPPDPAILRILAIYYVARRKLGLAHTYGTELLQIAQTERKVTDPLLYAEGCYTLGVTYFWQGRFQQARQQLEMGFAAYDRQHHAIHSARYGQDPGVVCLSRLAWALWYLGYPDQALQRSRQALDLANLLQHPFSIGYAIMFMQWLCIDARAEAVLAELTDLAAAYQQKFDFQPANRALAVVCRGKNLVAEGRVTEGIKLIDDGINMAAFHQYELMFKLHFQLILAQAQMAAGDFVQAKRAIQEALDHIAIYHDGYYEAELYRLQGELLLVEGKPYAAVESYFRKALNIACEQQAKALELRAAMSLCRLWAKQGKQGEAHALLNEVYGWFTEGFDTLDMQEARALLVKLA